ncbi:hypothetical protein Ari01nite_79370 [Paractinoplanes rishiriensis]|uniref:G5 domain-containing protein n=1 Tax=Paractinoplanes rishiriensis TaxID=1050105 RepID=A0A919K6X5_9ACTN|nr:hypothetical protein Ari01nite_79370 [Actinoplanes rishiriensis]
MWARLSTIQRAGLIGAALVLPCCGGVAVVGALSGDVEPATVPAPGAAVAAEQRADPPAPESGSTKPADQAAGTTTKTVKVRKSVGYPTRTVDDDSLAQGRTKVRTHGEAGERTLTYRVTVTGGRETGRKLVSDVVTRKPVPKVVAIGTRTAKAPDAGCDANYTPCVPIAQDVDCRGGSGDGPAYVDGPVRVIGNDPYDLDRDGDGVACD